MKYIFITLFILFNLSLLNSQTIVSTQPELRNVVLEEYTGINCVNCPQGHLLAENVAKKFPGRVSIINIHQGHYAIPNSGDPDFRTKWGDDLANLFSVNSYPSATINRMKYNGNALINRGDYLSFSMDSVLNGSFSPVNIAAKTKWNETTQEIEIYVEIYFTSSVPNQPKLNIIFLESGIPGYQTGAPSLPYIHNHILRDMITGQWGEDLENYSEGSFFSKTYKFKPDSEWNLDSSAFAIFISQSDKKNIYTGIEIHSLTPNLVINSQSNAIGVISQSNPFRKVYSIKNQSENNITINLKTRKSERTPDDWLIKVENDESEFLLLPGNSKELEIRLEQGPTKGIGDAIIEFTEKDNPKHPCYSFQMIAISSELDYIEVNDGSKPTEIFSEITPQFVSIDYELFKEVKSEMNALHIVMWNTGTGNELTAENATIIDGLLNKSIRVLFNGSVAIPKLVISEPNHQLLSTLGFTYVTGSDIIANAYNLIGVTGDPIGDGININAITRTNLGSFLEPMTITNNKIAFPVFIAEGSNKVISVRSVTSNSKAVYLSFFLDAITDNDLKKQLLVKCIKWLDETNEVDNWENNDEQIIVYPNPANGAFYLYNSGFQKFIDFALYDYKGNVYKILAQTNDSNFYYFSTENLVSGNYFLVVNSEQGRIIKNIIILK
ncbi:MAG TPA: Omp28-related outer membrane protein [Candidatus Kapabacteria bacterium]|nr:Omp28-related outer membrane protein [Candidatus Kapabacteria bacterium]HPO62038.1 Omp28-related outer membrane protein [Candidatus Kapabacteria bacterium]